MHPVEAVRRSGGYVTRSAAERAGVSRRATDTALAAGALVDAGRGALVLPGAPPALRAAARSRGMVSCVSALEVHGLPLGSRVDVPHVVVRSTRGDPRAVWHRGVPTDVVEPVAPAVARALGCLGRHDCLVVVDGALRVGVLARELVALAGPRAGADARWALRHGDAAAESPLESRLRALLLDARVTGVQLQARLPHIGRVDLLVDGWLVLEADGFAFHADRTSYRTDRVRSVRGARAGYVTLRFTWEDVVHQPRETIDTVLAVLRRRRGTAFLTAI